MHLQTIYCLYIVFNIAYLDIVYNIAYQTIYIVYDDDDHHTLVQEHCSLVPA